MFGKHKSLDKDLKTSMKKVSTIPEVSKIVLGFSECCRHKYPPGHIRFKQDVDGGIKVNGYSGKGVTDIFIKITPLSDKEKVKTKLKTLFSL